MRLSAKKLSKSSGAKQIASRGASRLARSANDSVFEPLEHRQMFSAASAIAAEYTATSHETDAFGHEVQTLLGSATSGVESDPTIAGAYEQTYHDNGVILYSPATGAHVLYGTTGAEYTACGKETDVFGRNVQTVIGLPTADEANSALIVGARVSTFQGGAIDWSAATNAHVIYGDIYAKYQTLGSETDVFGRNVQQVIGLPTTDEANVTGITGARVSTFQDGSIFWSSATGGHVVYGTIWNKLNTLGSETNANGTSVTTVLGLPTSDELNVAGITGARVSNFQGGSIYWSSTTGAHAVFGAIGTEYAATAHETNAYGTNVQSILGLPTSDEANTTGAAGGRVVNFQGGSIYWSVSTGAHAVVGAINALYTKLGGPASFLGLPTSDESGPLSDRVVTFQHGYIKWNPTDGAGAV